MKRSISIHISNSSSNNNSNNETNNNNNKNNNNNRVAVLSSSKGNRSSYLQEAYTIEVVSPKRSESIRLD